MSLIQLTPSHPLSQSWYRSPRLLRHGVMAFFFQFLLHAAWEHQAKGGGPNGAPSIEAYCPFGGIENLYQFVTTGGFIRHIEPSAMVLLVAVILLSLLLSRGFCGWVCPFGSLQEWLGLLGRRIFGLRYNPPSAWDKRLRYLKYLILLVIVGLTWHLGSLVFRPYDPFLAFFHLGAGFGELPYAYAVLGVVLVASLKYERFFCKYACPLGAVIGVLGKVGLTRVIRSEEGCKGCHLCQKKCFAHIDFLSTKVIRDAECNHCLDCVLHCPKPNVLTLRGLNARLSHGAYAAVLVLGLAGVIGVSQATAYWRTKPATVSFTGGAGRLDPEQMRGWMTLRELSDGYHIPLQQLYQSAQLPAQVDPSTRLNQIARTYKLDFEPDRVREIIGSILAHGSIPEKTHKSGTSEEVKGFMSLREIARTTGVPEEWLRRCLAVPAEIDGKQPVREWMHSQGRSIQDVRKAVADYRAGHPQ